jgi:hypothetical protein
LTGSAGLQRRADHQRGFRQAAALLSATVLSDSAAEHYRAGFHNRAMFIAPLVAGATLAAAAARPAAPGRRSAVVYGTAIGTGFIGFGFHLFNISRRVGGWSSGNLFNGAPAAAPLALSMAGAMGIAADRAGRAQGRFLNVLVAVGLLGTSAEAGVFHFRGAFQNPAMYAPLVVPPVTAVALAWSGLRGSRNARATAHATLHLTAWLGVAGTVFHAWGVHRRMGGWRNWRQNLFAGPPVPAPPAFVALALAGLASLDLSKEEQL